MLRNDNIRENCTNQSIINSAKMQQNTQLDPKNQDSDFSLNQRKTRTMALSPAWMPEEKYAEVRGIVDKAMALYPLHADRRALASPVCTYIQSQLNRMNGPSWQVILTNGDFAHMAFNAAPYSVGIFQYPKYRIIVYKLSNIGSSRDVQAW